MESTCKDEIVIDTELVETFGEVALVYEPTSLVYYDKSEDDPATYTSALVHSIYV